MPDTAQRGGTQGASVKAEEKPAPLLKACRICREHSSDYLVMPCRHWVGHCPPFLCIA